MSMLINRGAWIRLVLGSGLLTLIGAPMMLWERGQRFLRPPGAGSAEEFLALCLKCQRCVEVCPRGALTAVHLGEGVAGAGTPRLTFRDGYCDLCLKCITACPTGALRPVEPETTRLGLARIDPVSCIAWSWSGCTRCVNLCPRHALTLDDRHRPVVIDGQCNGCGLCENICSSQSVRRYDARRGKGIVVVPLRGTE